MTKTLWTINSIQTAMRSRGSYWWDPGTMRSFGTRPVGPVYQGPGGVYFVTSDYTGFDRDRRGYTVRRFDPDEAEISTVAGVGEHARKSAALRVARTRAAGDGDVETTAEEFRPISVAEQFRADLAKHGNGTATQDDARALMRLARRHDHHMVDECNCGGQYDDEGEPRPPLRRLRQRIEELARSLGATGVTFSGDPRGVTVRLTFADGHVNDFAREGYCVPTEE